ncbi:MAG: hypothetical protein ACFFC3_04120, partial [Candidatus Odinarchaeota archaeon]
MIENITHNSLYHQSLLNSINFNLFKVEPEEIDINEQFKLPKEWYNTYLGTAIAEFHGLNNKSIPAIRDENRNAIIPEKFIEIEGKIFYLSVKGSGAYEDMFFGGNLNPSKIKNACRDLK